MTTLREVLEAAERSRVAVGHFNFSDLVTLKAVATTAGELAVPVMVGVSEGERAFLGVRLAAAAVKTYRDELGLSLFLNADHTHSLANAEDAARSGFDEIIFDRSELPIEENVKQTRRAVEAIKSINPSILVEGEIGYIGTSSEILAEIPEGMGALTTPEEARQFVTATGVDVLAPAVGNMGCRRSLQDLARAVRGRERGRARPVAAVFARACQCVISPNAQRAPPPASSGRQENLTAPLTAAPGFRAPRGETQPPDGTERASVCSHRAGGRPTRVRRIRSDCPGPRVCEFAS
jgi:hypothetical protein